MPDTDKSSPRPWTYENVEVDADRTAYGVVKDANGKALFDTMNSDVAVIHTDTDTDSPNVYRWDEQGEQNLTLAVRAMNRGPAFDALVAAIKPFAAYVDPLNESRDADRLRIGYYPNSPTVGDVRRAAAALKLAEES